MLGGAGPGRGGSFAREPGAPLEAWRTWRSQAPRPAHDCPAALAPEPPPASEGRVFGPRLSCSAVLGPLVISRDPSRRRPGSHPEATTSIAARPGTDVAMPSFGDLVRDWQLGAQAVARGDWGCALRLFSGVPDPPARMCFNVGCVHLLAGDPEAALRVSQGAPGSAAETLTPAGPILWPWGSLLLCGVGERSDKDPAGVSPEPSPSSQRSPGHLPRVLPH